MRTLTRSSGGTYEERGSSGVQVVLPEGPTQYTRDGWIAYGRDSVGLVWHHQLCTENENQL